RAPAARRRAARARDLERLRQAAVGARGLEGGQDRARSGGRTSEARGARGRAGPGALREVPVSAPPIVLLLALVPQDAPQRVALDPGFEVAGHRLGDANGD